MYPEEVRREGVERVLNAYGREGRVRRIQMRLTEDEYIMVRIKAGELGLSITEFLLRGKV